MKHNNKECIHCGKGFYTPPCLERVKYCSQMCCKRARRGKKLSEEWRKNISEGIKKNPPSTAWRKGQHFSPATEFKKGENLGEKHPNWKGGKRTYRSIYAKSIKNILCEKCGSEKNIHIHHIDKNRDNNKLDNLMALCCSCYNLLHKKGKGYCFDKHNNRWKAYISVNGKEKHLGMFKTEEEAKQARQKAISK